MIDEAIKVCGTEQPTYISFDVDALDPVYAPGTGTPEVGGMTTLEARKFPTLGLNALPQSITLTTLKAQMLLRGLSSMNLIGADVVEVAPPFDPSGNTAMVGAQMVFEVACAVVSAVARRRGLQ